MEFKERIRHRILNSAGSSGTHVALLHSVPHHRSSFNLLGAENRTFWTLLYCIL